MFNAGFISEARNLAEKFIRAFHDADFIVAPSGSCISMVKHRYAELDLTGSYLRDWESIRQRIYELTEFLVDKIDVEDVGSHLPFKVGIHNSCHALRELGIREQPLKLLKNVDGLELIDDNWNDGCCGFGGVFNAKYPELSLKMGIQRAQNLKNGNPDFITGVDDSCLMHLNRAFQNNGQTETNIQPHTIHIARILASTTSEPFMSEKSSGGGMS